MKAKYLIAIHLMRWLTIFFYFRFEWTATAATRIHTTKAWLSLLMNFKNAIWTWEFRRMMCNHHHHHHHHVARVARISMTISRHSSLSFITLGRSSGQLPVSSHSCWMYVRAGRPAFARPCVGVHKSTSLMSSSLLKQAYAIEFCFILGKMPQKRMECFILLLEYLAWIKNKIWVA